MKLADYAKFLTTTAKMPHRWEYRHDEIGYNYRMPNINAALGCAQLEMMDTFVASKRRLTKQYEQLFEPVEGVQLFVEPPSGKSNYWLQTLLVDESKHSRDFVLDELNSEGVMARPIWTPLNELAPYSNCPKSDLFVTNQLNKRVINIPSTPLKGGNNDQT